MLTLTETASTVVREIVARRGGPEGTGLRISAEEPDSTEFSVAIVPTPMRTRVSRRPTASANMPRGSAAMPNPEKLSIISDWMRP